MQNQVYPTNPRYFPAKTQDIVKENPLLTTQLEDEKSYSTESYFNNTLYAGDTTLTNTFPNLTTHDNTEKSPKVRKYRQTNASVLHYNLLKHQFNNKQISKATFDQLIQNQI